MVNELCMNCFGVKGSFEVCQHCGYVEGTPPKQPHHLVPSTILMGRYLIGTSIGSGGFGITYKAYDGLLGVIVAIKEFYPVGLVNRSPGESRVGVLSSERMEEYQEHLRRFILEAQTMGQFGKSNEIVNVFEFFEENNTAYSVMEYIDGVPLKEFMGYNKKMDTDTAIGIIQAIMEAVKKVHANGIIHRDVSPDNVMIADGNVVKLFDFGSTKFGDEKGGGAAATALVKEGYAAPEQYRSKSEQGRYTDVYAIGAILYEMVTGVRPIEASERVASDALQYPTKLGAELGSNVDKAIMKALAVEPKMRFQTVEHFQEAIDNKRQVEYPDVEIRNHRRKRRVAIVLSAAFSLFVVAVIILFATFLWGSGRTLAGIALHSDDVVVWVPVDATEADQIEASSGQPQEQAQDGGVKVVVPDGISQDGSRMLEAVSKMAEEYRNDDDNYPDNKNITFYIEGIPISQYRARFEGVMGTEDMPDLYGTDYLSNGARENGANLRRLYNTLDKEGEDGGTWKSLYRSLMGKQEGPYYFLSGHKGRYPTGTEIPLGFQMLFVYARKMMNGMENPFFATTGTTEAGKGVELGKMIEVGLEEGRTEFVAWEDGQYARSLYLLNDGWMEQGTYKPNDSLREGLANINRIQQLVRMRNMTETDGVVEWFGEGREVQAIIGDVSTFKRIQDAVRTNYRVRLLMDQDKALVDFCDNYAVNKESSENKRNACMRFLQYMLTDKAQRMCYGTARTNAFPIRKESMEQTINNTDYNQFQEVRDMLEGGGAEGRIRFVGENHLALHQFNEEVVGEVIRMGLSEEEIGTFLESKVEDSPKPLDGPIEGSQ